LKKAPNLLMVFSAYSPIDSSFFSTGLDLFCDCYS